MHENLEKAASTHSGVDCDTFALDQQEIESHDLLFSERVASLCYWATIVLLAIACAHLMRWEIAHVAKCVIPAINDFWGITTPPWLIAPLAPIGMFLSLGHAVWSALHGQRKWRMVMTAGGLILVLASGKLLQPSL